MGQNLGVTTLADVAGSTDIFAGHHGTMEVSGIVIASGQNLKRGTLLAKDTNGEYVKLDTTAVDSKKDLVGILGCDVDATSADGKGFMYVHGEFLLSALNSTQTVVAGVYNSGSIVIKELI